MTTPKTINLSALPPGRIRSEDRTKTRSDLGKLERPAARFVAKRTEGLAGLHICRRRGPS